MNPSQKIDDHLVEEWVKLYKAGYSTHRIARRFHVGQRTVWRHLSKIMKLRDLIQATTKYPKKPFSGNLTEKAYLLGLRYTDLYARKHRNQIQVWLSTTHPHMLNLFTDLFSKYTTVRCYPICKIDGQSYEWTGYCYLDNSFEFLTEVTKRVPNWVLTDDTIFLSFFAGCIDGDGSIYVERKHELWYPTIGLYSENRLLLDSVFQKLRQMGYTPRLNVAQHKGSATYSKYRLNNDLWALRLSRKSETINLLKRLPLKHAEKFEKRKIILGNVCKPWTELEDKVHELRESIRRGVSEHVTKAQREYKHRIVRPPSNPKNDCLIIPTVKE